MSSCPIPNATQAKQEDFSWYLPLYKAATQGDWETAKRFLDADPDAVTAKITGFLETALHVAAGTRKATHFLENLMELIPPESLETLMDFNGKTVLHTAAQFGNIEAAKILVERNHRLSNIWSTISPTVTPLGLGAKYGHKELTSYLFTVAVKYEDENPFAGEHGVTLLNFLIRSEIYDIALKLVRLYPKLGALESPNGTPLGAIAEKSSAFPSGTQYKPWQWFIYSRVPVKSENVSDDKPNVRDSENPCRCSLLCTKMGPWARFVRGAHFIQVYQKFHRKIRSIMETLVPQLKNIRETKQIHSETLQLVKCLCIEIASLDHATATSIFTSPVHSAAKLGIHEVAEEILESFPAASWFLDSDHHDIFHLAVINRREKVFNLLYQLSEHSRFLTLDVDNNGDSILHLAGKLAPPHRINLVSGAALQMQRELRWYEEIRKWVPPWYEELRNLQGKTPSDVFTEEHKDLLKEGERWMKDTANSCSLSAALIATIAFAAAITVPGGTAGDSGFPLFSKEATFIVFAISNAVSLFSSAASLLMFLFILTARYAEVDFLFSLPRRLVIGLITLFLSITSMMIAFSATLYLLVGNKSHWVLVAVAVPACLPVTLFVWLQFPLLLDMICSTYGREMFGCNKGESGSRH